jgi:hypothetical protein
MLISNEQVYVAREGIFHFVSICGVCDMCRQHNLLLKAETFKFHLIVTIATYAQKNTQIETN